MIRNIVGTGFVRVLFATLALLAFFGTASYAYAADLTWNADQTVSLSSFADADFTIVSGSEATSMVVNAGDIQVVVANADTFTLTSPNSQLSVSGATTATATASCGDGGVSTATVTGGSGGETITITASTNRCSFGGNGGGGSSNSSANASNDDENEDDTQDDAADSTPTTPSSSVAAQYAALVAQLKALIVAAQAAGFTVPAAALALTDGAAPGTAVFTRDLDVGSSGEDVRALQVYLNAHGAQIAESGPGAPGSETSLFGGLTRAALARFQATNGISPAVGYFGPLTRSYIQTNP